MVIEPITSFRGEYRWLSNFHYVDVDYKGWCYPTTEHAYQAAKCRNPEDHDRVANALKPADAMRLGRSLPSRDDWEQIKLQVMLDVTRSKFAWPSLGFRLLATGDAELIEGNSWRDFFWGVCDGVGENNLGKILMRVRKELRVE